MSLRIRQSCSVLAMGKGSDTWIRYSNKFLELIFSLVIPETTHPYQSRTFFSLIVQPFNNLIILLLFHIFVCFADTKKLYPKRVKTSLKHLLTYFLLKQAKLFWQKCYFCPKCQKHSVKNALQNYCDCFQGAGRSLINECRIS